MRAHAYSYMLLPVSRLGRAHRMQHCMASCSQSSWSSSRNLQ
jgi:hypothetical protein